MQLAGVYTTIIQVVPSSLLENGELDNDYVTDANGLYVDPNQNSGKPRDNYIE